ncbi:hypothetical protein AYO21_04651 [Fonsecaea monophora]|uniref:Uncharacterized protein n=1 Tax=Fonsecaea monophora TaxID=254056 RepID=A0A177FA71_9EURO|nr:hypothetical protein AYO21_04651 [Fonsecaea monophora]KAH0839054.1 hypothetical protein FOPE_05414 [Fonsecaea pedrosoi]OAG41038.1 hypothetical protein AYO21_04651 [Fonsecaea monophora]
MIRLPPSSLSVSERDIDFHVRQTEIYQGLLRQGFKRDDIIRYLNDYRKAAADVAYPGLRDFDLTISSTAELSYLRLQPALQESGQEDKKRDPVRHSSSESTSGSTSSFPDLPPEIEDSQDDLQDVVPDALVQETGNHSSLGSSRSIPPTLYTNPHAPRKSSLLRFAEAASPEHPPTKPGEGRPVPVPTHTPIRRKYKRRSHTYPYQSSERDSLADTLTQGHVIDGMNRISLDDSEESMPFDLPSPMHPTTRTSSAQDIPFASPPTKSPSGDSPTDVLSPSITRSTVERRRSSDILAQMYSFTDVPSSPPFLQTPGRDYFEEQPSSLGSTRLPSTPSPIRNAASLSRTEPPLYRHQYLDGNSYTVYNDSLPASSQPQTPADTSRHPLVTEQEAAYTAPPGMLRIGSTSVTHHGRQGWDQEGAQQSPTARAINLRERRNRELTRSAHAEGVRLQRLRMRDESRFTQRALEANAAATGGDRVEAFSPTADDVWRDELEADRVGEENFEAGNDSSHRRVMRAVSGNARFDLGDWHE